MRIENKNAIITGGASGIGRATARRFAAEGANVMIADRNLAAGEQLARELGAAGRKVIAHGVDVSEEAQVDSMVDRAVRELGGVDILVAAAAIPYAGFGGAEDRHRSIIDKPFAEWRELLSVNLDGVFLVDRAVARAMVKAGRGGRIINISSIMALRPAVNSSDYCVSKAGVWMLTKVLALELAPHRITVNAIAPGGVRTPMLGAALERDPRMEQAIIDSVPLHRIAEPEELAATALFLASEDAAYYTGALLHVNGGTLMV
ncbi:MAG TPA: SDR family NAD(P)-dependent oxidoreductase [Candidatus Binataceae bacterium]|jgi:NAD(P)-dependent dehydrogenase (short-subunit alcohol dehydrogenase family)